MLTVAAVAMTVGKNDSRYRLARMLGISKAPTGSAEM